jgi:hypothetical protein
LLLRTNDFAVAALASFIAIGSKFLIRWKNKYLFNPTNLALVVVLTSGSVGSARTMGTSRLVRVSHCLSRQPGGHHAARVDITLAF